MRLTRITAPTTGVVSLAEAMDHLRISDTSEAALVDQYVSAASAYLDAGDGVLGEALVTQTWRLYMDEPAEVTLPLGPVQSIAAVRYLDAAGAQQTFNAANYRLSGSDFVLVDGAVWPTVQNREEAFWIDFVAGYGVAGAVPATVRSAALMLIGEMYEARTMGAEMQTSDAFKMLLAASRSERGLF